MMKASEVWNEQERRKNNRMSAMVPVMSQINAKIKTQAIHNAKAPYIVFEVPTYVFGYPLFTITEATEFLVREYSRAGYWVWVVDQKYLVISWIKPVKSRDVGKPILTTNYRPQIYDPTMFNVSAYNPSE